MVLPIAVASVAAKFFLPELVKHLAGDKAGRLAGEVLDVVEAAAGQKLDASDVAGAENVLGDLQTNSEMSAELTVRLAEIVAREEAAARAMEFEAIAAQIAASAKVAEADARSEHAVQRYARPAALWGATACCLTLILTVVYGAIFDQSALAALVGVMPFITTILMMLLAVGGVYVWARHREKKDGVAGPGVVKMIDDLI